MQSLNIHTLFACKVVSDDGKKVRPRDHFTERAKEELQASTVRLPIMRETIIFRKFFLVMVLCLAVSYYCCREFAWRSLSSKPWENIWCGWKVGSVDCILFPVWFFYLWRRSLWLIMVTVSLCSLKTIRICHPQESNSSRSKCDFSISNKVDRMD